MRITREVGYTCRVCNTQGMVSQRRICRPCETWLLGGPVAREVANTEVWLELQAQLWEPSFPREDKWPNAVGTVLGIVGLAMLIVEYWRVF